MERYAIIQSFNGKLKSSLREETLYLVRNETERAFDITNSVGNRCYCIKECCAHLNGGNWLVGSIADVLENIKEIEI